MKKQQKVIVVIVTYYPNFNSVIQVIRAISPQVQNVVVVDNTPSTPRFLFDACSTSNINLIKLSGNYGIAYAQNIGIERAIDIRADFVLFLDQDSLPSHDMVARLLIDYSAAVEQGVNLAAIGPVTIDRRNGSMASFVGTQWGFPRKIKPAPNLRLTEFNHVNFLISSGSLVLVDVFRKVGGMRSNYFIDHVDTEWCLRARLAGYELIGAKDIYMHHAIGDYIKSIWFFGWKNVVHHNPIRNYYMFRNTVLILHDIEVGFVWRLFLLLRLIKFTVYFSLFGNEKLDRLSMMWLGIRHGVSGVRGQLDIKTKKCHVISNSSMDPTL